jgi:AcrR family transcriptional regulator
LNQWEVEVGNSTQGAEATRARLVESAVRLFAVHGYAAASVRQVAAAAGVNLAAASYHFGGKAGLYEAALRQAFLPVGEVEGASPGPPPRSRAEARAHIREFVREFMRALLPVGADHGAGRLLAREMTDPSPALRRVLESFVLPRNERLRALVRRAEPGLRGEPLQLAVSSIFGQCVFYQMARPAALRLLGARRLTPELVDRLADHVGTFSLAALSSSRARRSPRSSPCPARSPRRPAAGRR